MGEQVGRLDMLRQAVALRLPETPAWSDGVSVDDAAGGAPCVVIRSERVGLGFVATQEVRPDVVAGQDVEGLSAEVDRQVELFVRDREEGLARWARGEQGRGGGSGE
ncbi:MAG: hypothetical protein AAFP22_15720 [Planctomycetota bacterium]